MKHSSSTFDSLERLCAHLPILKGAFSRSTGGIDTDLVVSVLAHVVLEDGYYTAKDELRDLKQSVMQSRTLGDLIAVQKTIQAIDDYVASRS